MRILLVSSFLLFKKTRFGGAKRLFELANYLDRSEEMHLICFDSCNESEGLGYCRQEFRKAIDFGFPKIPVWKKAFYPPGFPAILYKENRQAIQNFISGMSFDAILLCYPTALVVLQNPLIAKHPNIVYLEDDFQTERYRSDAKSALNPFRKAFCLFRGWQMGIAQSRMLRVVKKIICISQEEMEYAKVHFPWLQPHIIQYGLPPSEYPIVPLPEYLNSVGFIGNFRHYPNPEAVDWFLNQVFPRLRKRDPRFSCIIAGRDIPGWLKAKHEIVSGVRFWENVERLEHFYGLIGIFVNPVRTGKGLRTKMIEAAFFGRPMVSTSLGAEGLQDTLGISIADTPEQFTQTVAELVSNPIGIREIVQRNRRIAETHFTVEAQGAKLLRLLEELPR